MAEELSMDQAFLKQLDEVIEAHLEDEQFGVEELTKELGLSRSHLHRKLNGLTGKSTSRYIREYRLDKAMEMLQNNVATASEIAYRVGFGSPTYFNTSFHQYFGYPPGEVKFRNQINAGSDDSSTLLQLKDGNTGNKNFVSKKAHLKRKVVFGGLLFIILISSLFYYFYYNSSGKSLTKTSEILRNDRSIGILPFKNLSGEKENQYFADGVMNDILGHLSSLKRLKVIPSVTMEHFRESPKTAPEIATELSISYLLVGSVQKYNGQIKILVQLIDAENDLQIWTKDFKREFKDVFKLESDIAKEVALELKMVLSPQEIEQIERIPTNNLEAYNLYLQGRYFNEKGGEQNLNYSLSYLEKAIELDPNFAMAYAELADTKLNLEIYGFADRNEIHKAKDIISKAIELDSTIAEVHSANGYLLCWYERNWKKAEREFEISIKLNPNYAKVHFYYSRYLQYVKGNFPEARVHIDKAISLNPFSYDVFMYSAGYYLQAGKYEKAFTETERGKEIDRNNLWAYWLDFENYVSQGEPEKAVEVLIKSWNLHPELLENAKNVRAAFDKYGIDGVYRWINDFDIKENLNYSNFIAEKFALLGEKDKALDWLEFTYKTDPVEVVSIKYNPHFYNLHEEPRFLALLEKLGLGNYD